MDEYIRKQDALNLPQSIERNLRGEIVERSIDVKDIEALKPVENVVSVVRCQGCLHFDSDSHFCFLIKGYMRYDDFCCYGKTR